MRILYYSDIHIEFREGKARTPWTSAYPLDLGPDLSQFVGDTDLVILAGDIGPVRPRRGMSAQLYAAQVSRYLRCPVVLVPGNHEYYGCVFHECRKQLMQQDCPDVS